MDRHSIDVQDISARVRTFYALKKPFRIFHGYTHSTRKSLRNKDQVVDTSSLNHIIHIHTSNETALVEPNVSMQQLVDETLKHGLVPLVVPEFPSITVGGGFAGTAGESSSFRHGFLDDTINWIEIVVPNGDVLIASDTSHPDLFQGVKGTFGSLGVTTLLEIRLMEAKPLVELTYYPAYGTEKLIPWLRKHIDDRSIDYVDAIQYSATRGLIITGRLVDEAEPSAEMQQFRRPQDEWFYLHAQHVLTKDAIRHTETVPIVDYLFRYDRGAFWSGRHVFTYFAMPFIRPLRRLFDFVMHSKILYHGLHETGMAKDNIIQDFAIPIGKADDFLEWLDREYGIYPFWICPMKKTSRSGFWPMANSAITTSDLVSLPSSDVGGVHVLTARHPTAQRSETATSPMTDGGRMLLSIGVYGPRLPHPKDFVAENRKLERQVKEIGGAKWLYAHNHYTKEEFWSLYDKEGYVDLRRKYHADYLPSVYDKTKYDWEAENRAIETSWVRWLISLAWWIWPVPGIYGVIRCLMESDYLITG